MQDRILVTLTYKRTTHVYVRALAELKKYYCNQSKPY